MTTPSDYDTSTNQITNMPNYIPGIQKILDNMVLEIGKVTAQAISNMRLEIDKVTSQAMSKYNTPATQSPTIPSCKDVLGTRKNILGLRRVLDNLGFDIGRATTQAIYLDGCGYVPADLRRDTSLKSRFSFWTPSHPRSKYITKSQLPVVEPVLTVVEPVLTVVEPVLTVVEPVLEPVVEPVLEPVVEPVALPATYQNRFLPLGSTHVVGTRKNILGLRRVLDDAGYGYNVSFNARYLDALGLVPADLRRRPDLLARYKNSMMWVRVTDLHMFLKKTN